MRRWVISILTLAAVACGGADAGPDGDGGAGGAPGSGGAATTSGPGGPNGSTAANGSGNGSGGGGGSGTSTGAGGAASCADDTQVHQGQATWYVLATPLVNCSYATSSLPPYYGAMNTQDYAESAVCGACVEVTAPNTNKKVNIQIVDQCPIGSNPICTQGHIDLNQPAFQQLDDLVTGVIPIAWKYVPCEPASNVTYRFKEGSSQYWTAVLLRNHRYAIAKVEYERSDGSYRELSREDYNYFVDEDGMGPGPYTFRVTDVHGQVIEDSGIPLVLNQDLQGQSQFPPCAE